MRQAELEYLADTLLIEELARIELGLTKQAGLVDQLGLDSIASSIKDFVQSHVRPDAPGGYVGSVLGLMTPAILFRLNPILGAVYLVASQLGFDIQSVMSKMVSVIKTRLDQGEPISSAEVSEIGKQAVASEAGISASAAPADLFEPLRKLATESQFKYAYERDEMLSSLTRMLGGGKSSPGLPKTPWLLGSGGGVVQKIFGSLWSLPNGKGKAMWLIGGFVIWLVKTVLVGAGLLAGAGMVSSFLKKKDEPAPETSTSSPSVSEYTPDYSPTNPEVKPEITPTIKPLTPPKLHSKEIWVVPLLNTVEETLLAWVEDLYPQVTAQITDWKEQLLDSPSFKSVVNLLKNPKKMGRNSLIIPEQFTSRQQITDLFIKSLKGS